MVLLPSLGRGADDFAPMADVLAEAGFRVLRPQPRGIGGSSASPAYASLHDCSNDIAAVIEADGNGPAVLVGHAFGNRVSRLLATIRPDLVTGVVLVAANVGHAPSPPKVREAIRNGLGIGLLPHYLARDDARLALVREVPEVVREIWLAYPQEFRGASRFRPVIDWLAGELRQCP